MGVLLHVLVHANLFGRRNCSGGTGRLTTTVDEFGIPLVIRSRRRSRQPGSAVARRVLSSYRAAIASDEDRDEDRDKD